MLVQLSEDAYNYRGTYISAVINGHKLLQKLELAEVKLKRQLTNNEEVVTNKLKQTCEM